LLTDLGNGVLEFILDNSEQLSEVPIGLNSENLKAMLEIKADWKKVREEIKDKFHNPEISNFTKDAQIEILLKKDLRRHC
jgi:hypothetical protein